MAFDEPKRPQGRWALFHVGAEPAAVEDGEQGRLTLRPAEELPGAAVTGEVIDGVQEAAGYTFQSASFPDYVLADTTTAQVLAAEATGNLVAGTTPIGSTINLFDYWATTKNEGQTTQKNNGINSGHGLKFSAGGFGAEGAANHWTGNNGGVLQGLVNSRLGADGYPQLSGDSTLFTSATISQGDNINESLAYLFDPADTGASGYRDAYSNVGGLLQIDREGYYYYDSQKNYAEFVQETIDGRTTNRFNLYDLPKVGTGSQPKGQFFPFNESQNVKVNQNQGDSDLNHFFGLTLTTKFVQEYSGHTDTSKSTETTFTFSGDDDVWIFVDGVLVADLGGIHDKYDVTINFAQGTVEIGKVYKDRTDVITHFRDIFAGTSVALNENGTLADNTYHTLKFFYLERGAYASNLSLKYNLNQYPKSSIYKVNQYGDALAGVEFAVYAADENYNLLYEKEGAPVTLPENYTYAENGDILDEAGTVIARALYLGTTDANGEMVFNDEDGMPATLEEMQKKFGDYFILKETRVPQGYRIIGDDIHLRITKGLLLCDNTFDSGANSLANLLVSAPNTVRLFSPYLGLDTVSLTNGDGGEETAKNGTLFAVVMKYVGNGDASADTTQTHWAPVYGSDTSGYIVADVSGAGSNEDYLAIVVDAAKRQAEIDASETRTNSSNVFTLSPSGAWQANIQNLPGDITKYYTLLGADEKSQTEYTLGYYWAEADTLQGATAETIHRVNANTAGDQYNFTRAFGATVNVPNHLNRLIVQKLDEEGALVNDATFGLYEVEELAGSTICYLATDGTKIHLDSGGTAQVYGDDGTVTQGTYTIDRSVTLGDKNIPIKGTAGNITVEAGGTDYTICPLELNATKPAGEQMVNTYEDGSMVFQKIESGHNYLVREIAAPAGYKLNDTEVMVTATPFGIYANAGTADDGITVVRGPGFIAKTLQEYASQGEVDRSLTWLAARLRVNRTDLTTFEIGTRETFAANPNWQEWASDISGKNFTSDRDDAAASFLKYVTKAMDPTVLFNYDVNDSRQADLRLAEAAPVNTQSRRLYTTEGWSYLEITQDQGYANVMRGEDAEHRQALLEGANYYDLGEPPQDISDLFSRSVYIQVTDEKVSNLEISKTVAGAPAGATPSFTFTVNLYSDGENTSLPGTYPYTVYTRQDGGADSAAAVGEIGSGGTVSLTHNQYVRIENLPFDAWYAVTEQPDDAYGTQVSVNGGEPAAANTAGGPLQWLLVDDTLNNTTTVAYTNTYSPDVELAVKKVAAEAPGTTLDGAEFVLYRREGDTKLYYTDGRWQALPAGGQESDFKLTTADGQFTFISAYQGTYFLKEITAPAGYNLLPHEIQITVQDGRITSAQGVGSPQTYSHTDTEVTVPNSAGIELPHTGGKGTMLYTLAGLLLCGAACLLYKKRGREGQM